MTRKTLVACRPRTRHATPFAPPVATATRRTTATVRRPLVAIWLALVLLGIGLPAAADPALSRDGITVWTFARAGSALHEFKAVTRVHSNLAGLVALLLDTEAAPQWIYRTKQVRVLSRDDAARTFTLHVVTDFWPLKDRDVVVRGKVQQDPASRTVLITSESIDDARAPAGEDYVRMPAMNGRWEFRPLGNGEVEVTLYGRADPGGMMPPFLVNLFTSEVPYQTLAGMRRIVGGYQHKHLPGLLEPEH